MLELLPRQPTKRLDGLTFPGGLTSASLGDGQREAARARTRRSTFAKCRACGGGASIANYDVTSGGRFIMIRRGANGGKLRVVLNWTDELKRILAAGGAQ